MKSIDIFVLPTLMEGTPNSVIEAMAHGVPVIASEVGGIPDLVTSMTGILVAAGDVDEFAAAIRRLALDPEERHRLGRAGRERYEELFAPDRVLPALVSTYRRLHGHEERARSEGAPPHPWLPCHSQ